MLPSATLVAQESASAVNEVLPPIPAPPADLIYDDTKAFSPEMHQALSEKLKAFAKDHGITVHVAAIAFVQNESCSSYANRLKRSWLGGQKGVIVLYERGSDQLTFASTQTDQLDDSQRDFEILFTNAAKAAASVSLPAESTGISAAAGAQVIGHRLQAAVDDMLPRLKQLDTKHSASPLVQGQSDWAVTGGVAAAVIVGGIAFFIGRQAAQKVSSARPKPKYFPTVTVEPRFGGAFGGGTLAEIDFSQSAAK